MTFKKSIALLLSGSMLAAAALTGCGSDNTASAVSNTAGKDLLDQIQARGSITAVSYTHLADGAHGSLHPSRNQFYGHLHTG